MMKDKNEYIKMRNEKEKASIHIDRDEEPLG